MITVRRPSGLAVPFDPPELTMSASIDRTCEPVGDAGLIGPKQPEYLPTYPVLPPGVLWEFVQPRIPWDNSMFADYYDHLI